MNSALICVGRLKERYWREAAAEYEKRLTRFGRFETIELPDLPEPQGASPAQERQIRQREGESILQRLRPGAHVIALTIPGRQWDSPGLARHLDGLLTKGASDIAFVIGGSLGLSEEVIARADEELSMSAMTFPHQLARVMLLEQLYRAMKIRAGERYHK